MSDRIVMMTYHVPLTTAMAEREVDFPSEEEVRVKVHWKFSICEGGNNVVLSLQILVRHIYPQHLPSNCAIYTTNILSPSSSNKAARSWERFNNVIGIFGGMIRRSRELFIQERRVGCDGGERC